MDVFWIIFLLAMGACVGSFLNVIIYRMPRGESIAFPGSHCPSCGRGIKPYDNIPVLSWLILRGRCRFCKASISPRYIIVESVTAALVAGLYVCYYVLKLRPDAGSFIDTWPNFAAHAALACALLACSLVDVEHYIVPLEVCWFISLVGVVAAAASPPAWMPAISPAAGAVSVGAVAGLAVALVLMHYGVIRQSFMEAQDKLPAAPTPAKQPAKAAAKAAGGKKKPPKTVAITKEHGVNPRVEILREVLFLAPVLGLALAAWLLVTRVDAVGDAWGRLVGPGREGLPSHLNSLLAAVLGYLIGGLWVWAVRILGTLGFGKEAMGMGDAHLMAAVGAVTGWVVPSVAFFVAPVFGLLWALYLWISRGQRELPYGPWLSAATLVVMVFCSRFADLLQPLGDFGLLFK